MGMCKCKSCGGWYNQQHSEKHCWVCLEQNKHLPKTVHIVFEQESTGHVKIAFVRQEEVDAKADVDFRVKQNIHSWYETKFLQ